MLTQLKLIIRNQVKRPVLSFVNVFGLSVSLALVIILSIYSYSEYKADSQHLQANDMYLFAGPDDEIFTPGILREAITNSVPGVKEAVRIGETWDTPVFQVENKQPVSADLIFADDNFFNVFTYTAQYGNLGTALQQPMSVVITSQLAAKLFGNESALGQVIQMNNEHQLTVTAVIDGNRKSSIKFSALANIESRKIIMPQEGEFKNWQWYDFQLILLLNKNNRPDEVVSNIIGTIPLDVQPDFTGSTLLPFKAFYFSGLANNEWVNYLKSGDKRKCILLTFVAFLVLIIALVNNINISTTQKQEKSKQYAVLKINGARYIDIFWDILREVSLLNLLAFTFAQIIILIFVNKLQQFTGIDIDIQFFLTHQYFIAVFVAFILLTVLSSMIPTMQSLHLVKESINKNLNASSKTFSKGVFVVFQFSATIVLICFTLLINKQIRYGQKVWEQDDKNIVMLQLTPQLSTKNEVLKNELQQLPSVSGVTFSSFYPGLVPSEWCVDLETPQKVENVCFNTFNSNAGLFSLIDLELISGRFYEDDNANDVNTVIVNEAFVKEYNIDDPLKGKLKVNGECEIVGVVKNFYYQSVNKEIGPLVIRNSSECSKCMIQLANNNFKQLQSDIEQIQNVAQKLSPSFPVEVAFFDQSIEKMYQSEILFQRAFGLFSICAIIICALGVLALALSTCQKRVKEIGIRKVNGARIYEILKMLNIDFIRWIVVAFIIAAPVAYYAMQKWLENFAYKTTLSWWVFAGAGVITLAVALLSVSWQSYKAATRNPVEALRYE